MVVVGVVGDVQDVEYGAPPPPMVYLPHGAVPWPDMTVMVRADGDPIALAAAVRHAVHAVDATLAVPSLEPLTASLRDARSAPRFYLLAMSTFAGVALLLAATGIYGALSFTVVQHTREIGIRLALGAQPGDVLGRVLRVGLRLAVLGLALGVLGAVAASRLLESLLYETSPLHLATYAGVAALLMAVALVASYLPGRRATRIDPREAISAE
jgi:predicted lysophospholipase L1 biosynthesis ABC-type transport system permease subunit